MSNLSLRLIFGAIYVAIMIGGAFLGRPFFGLLLALLSFLSISEMATLAKKESMLYKWAFPMFSLVTIAVIAYNSLGSFGGLEFGVAWVLQLVCLFFSYSSLKKSNKINYWSAALYLLLPLAMLAVWSAQYYDFSVSASYGLFYLITIWAYDSMAYVVGRSLGKRPVFPKVSPKKTIEGTIGGFIVTWIAMVLVSSFFMINLYNAIFLVPVIVIFAIFGDFVESYMKRKINVKDSGSLIPGHGGILDRLDSIYLSALPYLVILLLL